MDQLSRRAEGCAAPHSAERYISDLSDRIQLSAPTMLAGHARLAGGVGRAGRAGDGPDVSVPAGRDRSVAA